MIIDLTRPLNADTAIYRDGDYADPPLVISPWCEIAEAGFRVARLELGTQTGTHIDAPAHFLDGGATLDALDPAALIGPYFRIDAEILVDPDRLSTHLAEINDEAILLIRAQETGTTIPAATLDALLQLGRKVWVMAGSIEIALRPELEFHRRLAQAGVYLVEDIDLEAAARLPERGRIIALPLRLEGVSGSPCRVLALPLTEGD